MLDACDQLGATYALPLTVGDRVRLFARTNAAYADRGRGIIGNNGSVLEVQAIGAEGVVLRNANGRAGLVNWDTLRDPTSGRIRLSYGDVLTIDAAQGLTSTEHIQAMPAGTPAVTAFKAYTRGKPAPPGELLGHLGRGGAAGDRGTPAAWRSAADPGSRCVGQHGAQPRSPARDASGAGFVGAGTSNRARRRARVAEGAASRPAARGGGTGEDHAAAHLAATAYGRACGDDDGSAREPGAPAGHGAGGARPPRAGGT